MTEQTAHSDKHFESWFTDETREHFRAAHKEIHESIKSMLPAGTMEHHQKARKEMLLAWRSVIDDVLNHMDEPEK